MKKVAFVDIGELGWSLLLSAHVRWYKKNTDYSMVVMTYPDRKCLYQGLVDRILDVPEDFYTRFPTQKQSCFGIHRVSGGTLKKYFESRLPKGYLFPFPEGLFLGKVAGMEKLKYVWEPYSCSKKLVRPDGKREILVFPRCRRGSEFDKRNLSEEFYVELIRKLCVTFPNHIIKAIGSPAGAYTISKQKYKLPPNYGNMVVPGADLQDMINRCPLAVAAVGAQSAPPKISLLQGVPTFMIGHEKNRHTVTDNWMKTKVGFYSTLKMRYKTVDTKDCLDKIIVFIKGCV